MKRLDWNEPVTARGVPLWRMALRMYAELGSYKEVRLKLQEEFGIEISYATLRQQIQDHATPDLYSREPSRRHLRKWLIEFLGAHGISMDRWIQYAAQREAKDGITREKRDQPDTRSNTEA